MRPHRRPIHLLLAACLVIGQWATALHAADHGLAGAAPDACEFCLQAAAPGVAAVDATPTAIPSDTDALAVVATDPAVRRVHCAHPPPRGPPLPSN